MHLKLKFLSQRDIMMQNHRQDNQILQIKDQVTFYEF